MTRLGLVMLLAACGGKPASSTTPSAPAPPAEPAPAPVADTKEFPTHDDKSPCADRPDSFGPFVLTKDQAAKRYGRRAVKLDDALTTKATPIEVCGIPMSSAWMSERKCAGGGPPKILGRVGSVGRGGRCGAIIDLYDVQCPEQLYKVFVDIYQCGPDETFL